MFRVLFALFVFLAAAPLNGQSRLLLDVDSQDLPRIAAENNLTAVGQIANRPIQLVNVSGSVPATVNSLTADPSVQGVEFDLDGFVTERQPGNLTDPSTDVLTSAAADPTTILYYGNAVRLSYVAQPAATVIRLAEAHTAFDGTEVVVAIIDTGVDPYHPVLRGALVPGYDFTRNSPAVSELLDLDPMTSAALTQSTVAFLDNYAARLNQSTVAFLDQSTVAFLDNGLPPAFGHGTMVAGLVHLVAPGAHIMPLKAFRGDGTSTVSDLVAAVYYAVDHGATVINMSFSLTAPSAELAKALAYASAHNVICVSAAGNMGNSAKVYPAGNRYVIGVGSTNALDLRSPFSNYDVSSARTSAPGEALITIFPGNHYAGVWGTSFSSALVTGGIALMRQAKPSASFSAIADALDHGYPIEQRMGDARLDLVRSLFDLIHN